MFGRKHRKRTESTAKAKAEAASSSTIRHSAARAVAPLLLAAAVCGGAAWGLRRLEGRILAGRIGAGPQRVQLRLASQPAWMPDALAVRILSDLLPEAGDYWETDLTRRLHDRLAREPWVREVRSVRKGRGDRPGLAMVDIDAEFRMPVASVPAPEGKAYVDADGVRLPAEEVPRWAAAFRGGPGQPAVTRYYQHPGDAPGGQASRVHYATIQGVAEPAPPVGQVWPGEDLAEGLRLARLICHKPYAWQITEIDVRNHAGRISRYEPHLCMNAQVDRLPPTNIRFGRFPHPQGDYVVSPDRKISYLDEYAAEHDGYLAGVNRYIDLRYDSRHVSVN